MSRKLIGYNVAFIIIFFIALLVFLKPSFRNYTNLPKFDVGTHWNSIEPQIHLTYNEDHSITGTLVLRNKEMDIEVGMDETNLCFVIREKNDEDFIFWMRCNYYVSKEENIVITKIESMEQSLGIPLDENMSFTLLKVEKTGGDKGTVLLSPFFIDILWYV